MSEPGMPRARPLASSGGCAAGNLQQLRSAAAPRAAAAWAAFSDASQAARRISPGASALVFSVLIARSDVSDRGTAQDGSG